MSEVTAKRSSAGIFFIILGMFSISINDMLIKALSGDYPLHQIVLTRSAIGIAFTLVLVQLEGGWQVLKTKTPGLHVLRGLLVVVSGDSARRVSCSLLFEGEFVFWAFVHSNAGRTRWSCATWSRYCRIHRGRHNAASLGN